MARILVCGTLAYDDIGRFATRLGPDTRNVKLTQLDQGFGGCAMNIAYNLAGLGDAPVPFVYVGDDYSGPYARHVAASGISEAGIFRIPDTPSARGIVLTGDGGDQLTAFYEGPSGQNRCARDLDALLADGSFDAAIVAPDRQEKMVGCAAQLGAVPLKVWCPGQYAELLNRDAVESLLAHCDLLVVNQHEWQALGRSVDLSAVPGSGRRVLVTDGPGPITLLPGGATVTVPAAAHSVDPTGCGDAFVAGLTSALLAGADMEPAVRAGVALAARCLGYPGAQRHPVDRAGNSMS